MPRHSPYDISYTQANEPVNSAAKNDYALPVPDKDPLENMLYDKYVYNYARLIAGSSNLVGLSSFTSEAGESDLLAPYGGWCNGVKPSYILGDANSRQRATDQTFYLDYGASSNPRITLLDRRNISFGMESGWVDGFMMNRYGVNEPGYSAQTISESAELLTHISGEFVAGRATHMFFWGGSNALYNNHMGVTDSETGSVIYSGVFDNATILAAADAITDQCKTVINVGKSAGAKGIVIGGIYNRMLFPTGWAMGFRDETSLNRVETFITRANTTLRTYAQTIGAVFVDYRDFQRDMQGNLNERDFVRFPAPYSHYKAINQRYDSVEGEIVNDVFTYKRGNGQAMFSDRGTFYYNLGQCHITNIMLHALNKCYGTSIKLIDPTEMVLLCGLQTDFNDHSSRAKGGGSGILPQDVDGGAIAARTTRPDFVVDLPGGNPYNKGAQSASFQEPVSRAKQSSVRFGGTNVPKKQDYDGRSG